jgi:lipid A 3-O-deacylase
MTLSLIFQKASRICIRFFIIFVLFSLVPGTSLAQYDETYAPTLTGIALNSGYTYDPSIDVFFSQISFSRLYDYDKIWFHNAPENLRFKIEASLGGAYTDNGDIKFIANVNMLALYYMESLETKNLKPYIEGGIGGIFTDYRVTGQAYRINFNPQAGIGVEFKKDDNKNPFISLRAHHISNGGLNDSNRGQNSIVFTLGQYF